MRRTRSGFTLVELLVVIVIIGILTSLALGGMYAARSSANKAATQSLVAELDTIIREKWDALNARRLPVAANLLILSNSTLQGMGYNQPQSTQQIAAVRLMCQRELARIELPSRFDDFLQPPIYLYPDGVPVAARTTAAREGYLRLYQPGWTPQYESAECLYLICTIGNIEGERPSDRHVGDRDGDGAREYHDAWGNPISFLRWTPGFRSDLQSGDATNDHDPQDVLRLQAGAFHMFPLVYSAGPDEIYDLWERSAGLTVPQANDPYFQQMGDPLPGAPYDAASDGNGSIDNIHSHLIEQ